MAKVAISLEQLSEGQRALLRPYHIGVDEDGQPVSKYKYRPGTVRQYRFDGKAGVFNIGGDQVLGKSLEFQPISWRFFTGNILGMGVKRWVEIFFIDPQNCVSAVLFHDYSHDNLVKLEEPLYWGDQKLSDVVITATAEKKQSKAENGGTYFMAQFTFKPADTAKVAEMAEFVADVQIWRKDTLNATCHITMQEGYPMEAASQYVAELSAPAEADNALPWEQPAALPEGNEPAKS